MSSPDLRARLRYLNDSAHLLATIAPSTSRHLRSRCDTLISEKALDSSDARRRNACGACGTIMILGWEGTLQTEPRPCRQRTAKANAQHVKQTKALVYECKTCYRKTRFPLSDPPQATRHKATSSNPRAMPTSELLTKPSPVSLEAKSNSKKRAKARKRGGLEALLALKGTSREVPGFGLDLMDFMKKS